MFSFVILSQNIRHTPKPTSAHVPVHITLIPTSQSQLSNQTTPTSLHTHTYTRTQVSNQICFGVPQGSDHRWPHLVCASCCPYCCRPSWCCSRISEASPASLSSLRVINPQLRIVKRMVLGSSATHVRHHLASVGGHPHTICHLPYPQALSPAGGRNVFRHPRQHDHLTSQRSRLLCHPHSRPPHPPGPGYHPHSGPPHPPEPGCHPHSHPPEAS